ncbi:uncharacterized protein LOC135366243 [Ornithodoros turicata]|uniref:uncharacterized protein LOC135366243 n=1 Tax=Ornithodoros turicata TaxID=34597 RepID=UPI003138C5F0
MTPRRPSHVLQTTLTFILFLSAIPSQSNAGSRRKSSKYKTTYYIPAEHRSTYYYQWPYQDPKLSRRSYTAWDDSWGDSWSGGSGGITLVPSFKGFLDGTNKHFHLHRGGGKGHGCGIEIALLGILVFLPLISLMGLVVPLLLFILPLLIGLPLLQPPFAVGPIVGVPGDAIGPQGRRRRSASSGRPVLEDVISGALSMLQEAISKYGGL